MENDILKKQDLGISVTESPTVSDGSQEDTENNQTISSQSSDHSLSENIAKTDDIKRISGVHDFDAEGFDTILKEYQQLIQHRIVSQRDYFKKTALRPMRFFRIVGVLIIILSVSVPFLATMDESPWSIVILSMATLSIAALTGLNSFFNWQYQWQSHRQTQFALEHLLNKWELIVIRTRHIEDKEKAIHIVITAGEELFDNARAVTETQTSGYFQGIQFNQT